MLENHEVKIQRLLVDKINRKMLSIQEVKPRMNSVWFSTPSTNLHPIVRPASCPVLGIYSEEPTNIANFISRPVTPFQQEESFLSSKFDENEEQYTANGMTSESPPISPSFNFPGTFEFEQPAFVSFF